MVEDRGPQLRGVASCMVSLALVAMTLRVYVRLRLVKAFGWDDAWMVFALVGHVMFASCAIAGIHYGTGRHYKDLTPEGIYQALRYWWLCYIAYCFTMIGAKISIGLFLIRITPKKVHHWIIYTVMGLTVLTGLVFLFVTIFQCSPISHFWGQALGEKGSCINVYVIIGLTYLYSVISAICDFTFGLLPVVLVWNLNMSRNQKFALIPILSMACVASVAVVVRMGFVMRFVTDDFLYDTVDIAIWSDIEQGLAITAASLATLRPLYRLMSERLGFSTGVSSSAPRVMTPYGRSGFSNHNKKKPSGPFSLTTFNNAGHYDDEEAVLKGCRHVKIEEEEQSAASSEPRRSWYGGNPFASERPETAVTISGPR